MIILFVIAIAALLFLFMRHNRNVNEEDSSMESYATSINILSEAEVSLSETEASLSEAERDFGPEQESSPEQETKIEQEPELPPPKREMIIEHFSQSEEAFNNPFMGYMPFASTLRESDYPEPDFTLAFALLYWKDIEAEKDVYDFTSFEKLNQFEHLRNHNIKLVIRIVTDYPGKPNHIDIPLWLYEEMNGAGVYYNAGTHSAGFAPDYQNSNFIKRHGMMLKAVAKRYDDSPDIAFIQLGSLGHWGEWHNVYVPGGYFPPPNFTDIYVNQYLSVFKNTIIQMRRPFAIMNEADIGLFNDMLGHADQTDWLVNEIQSHGLNDFYLNTPMGGEFASTNTVSDYFSHMYDDVKKMFIDTNVTYVGCLPPTSSKYQENRLDLLKTMGYRLFVSSVEYTPTTTFDDSADFFITMKNTGVAPFYYKWPFYLLIFDDNDSLVMEYKLDDWVQDIIPNGTYVLAASIPPQEKEGSYTVKLGLFDPLNEEKEKADIRLANIESQADNLLTIGMFTQTQSP